MKIRESGRLDFTWAILLGIFLLIGILFYFSLGVVKSGEQPAREDELLVLEDGSVSFSPENVRDFSFGLEEILFAFAFAVLMTGFMLWTKSIMKKNVHLGLIIGLLGSIVIGYSFSLKYRGTYSTIFMIIVGLIIVVFLGMNYFKYKK